jgi:Holliday junction resolvasome RuvABC ATP-dependent DNA helicase subunit
MTERLSDLGTTHRYFGSSTVDEVYNEFARVGLVNEKWQLMRLSVAMSLLDPKPVENAPNRTGSEIRAETIFSRDDSFAAFAALVAHHAGRRLELDEIGSAIEAHWHRGANALLRRMNEAVKQGRQTDAVILDLLREAGIAGDGTVPPAPSEDPDVVFEHAIVAQEAAKAQVLPLLRQALLANPRVLSANLLFTGPASTGKTLFSSTIAQVLGLPFVDMNGDTLKSIDQLLDRLTTAVEDAGMSPQQVGTQGGIPKVKYPPAIVFIDECHRLSAQAQNELLTAIEPKERKAKTNDQIADLEDITFLLATTDSAKLIQPLQTRCRIVSLDAYTRDQVAKIIQRSFGGWPTTVYEQLAVAGRLIPRQALTQAGDFKLYLEQERSDERASENVVLAYMESRGMNSLGLVKRDYHYLQLLSDGKPRALNLIAKQLQLDEAEVENTVEPYLWHLKFVERGSKGRTITSKGLEHLREHSDEKTT